MTQRRINMSDIVEGEALPWDVCDYNGTLLLKKGYIVQRHSQIEALVERGLFAEESSGPSHGPGNPTPEQEQPSVLRLINLANKRLERLLFGLHHEPAFAEKILEVAKVLGYAIDLSPDVAVACVLLNQQASTYPIRHCIDSAVISTLIARSTKIAPEEIAALAAAALTMNVGMITYHTQLQNKQGTLSDKETELIHQHPQAGVKLLESAGVRDPDWLAYVLYHHENEDGSGYLSGLAGKDIPQNAKIISLADRYCARISARDYRKQVLPNTALRDIFLDGGKGINPMLAALFIKELGIYPPGTLVRLINGEIGVVSKKGETATTPIVHALVGPRGVPLSLPIRRETAKESFAIQETLHENQANIRFSMHQIWGDVARL